MTDASLLIRDSFLDIDRSFGGRAWTLRCADERAALTISQRLGVPEIIGRILAGRGVGPDNAAGYLDPSLRTDLPDPLNLIDMKQAVARTVAALNGGEQIAVFGDYDVDGATSSALLSRWFSAVGVPLSVYIPDRLQEGYGPNAPALRRLRAEGADLVITVDCGATAFAALADAAANNLDIIVLDHHLAEGELPVAAALVNPNRGDCSSGCGELAAVGVTFLFLVALNRVLRGAGWFAFRGAEEPDLRPLLDLVALGTVCDVAPMTGVNRVLVKRGLEIMARRGNVGLTALADIAGMQEKPGVYHAGFLLGPRINAGGRVGRAGAGARLLATDDPIEARALSRELDVLNGERRVIEAEVLQAAIDQVEATGQASEAVIFAVGEGWHVGVIGIVASRLKEKYGCPAFVVAIGADGIARGSGRSITGVDLGGAVARANLSGLLINGGGHKMAAGLTLAAGAADAAFAAMRADLAPAVARAGASRALKLDGALSLGAATKELWDMIERAGPYGPGNPGPRFALTSVRIAYSRIVGENHVKITLADASGARMKAIAFRAMDTPLGDALFGAGNRLLHVAGTLKPDTWTGGEALEMQIEDAAPAL